MLLYAALVSTAVLFVVAAWQRKLRQALSCSPKQYLRSAALGFLNPFLYYLVLFEAYDRLPAQEAQPLNYTWPIVVVILSVPLLETAYRPGITGRDRCKLLRCLRDLDARRSAGLQFQRSVGHGPRGRQRVHMGHVLAEQRPGRPRRGGEAAFELRLRGWCSSARRCLRWRARLPWTPRGIGGSAYAGVFEMGVTFVLWMRALSLSRTTAQVSNLVYLSPFVSLVLISVIVGETILLSSVIGLMFIIGGIVIRRFDRAAPQSA